MEESDRHARVATGWIAGCDGRREHGDSSAGRNARRDGTCADST